MKTDVVIDNSDYYFNYRVAIVIRNHNKLLVQLDTRVNHITFPGGRCQLGESSINTAIREFYEETGISLKFVKHLGIIENFFVSSFNKKNYHEILIVNELQFENPSYYDQKIINNIENKNSKYITCEWKTKDELKNLNFQPDILLDKLNSDIYFHSISK